MVPGVGAAVAESGGAVVGRGVEVGVLVGWNLALTGFPGTKLNTAAAMTSRMITRRKAISPFKLSPPESLLGCPDQLGANGRVQNCGILMHVLNTLTPRPCSHAPILSRPQGISHPVAQLPSAGPFFTVDISLSVL